MGMVGVDKIGEIRRAYFEQERPIKESFGRFQCPARRSVRSSVATRRSSSTLATFKRTRHPEFKDRTIWDVFEEERASLMQLRGPFDGFVEKAVRASTTCLIMADHNR